MEEVHKYKCLCKKYCKDYKDKYRKTNAWKAVGENLSWTRMRPKQNFKI